MTPTNAERLVAEAIECIDHELGKHGAGTPGAEGDPNPLTRFRACLQSALQRVRAKDLPPADQRTLGLASVIVDSWPFDSPLGAKMIAAEQGCRRFGDL